MAAGVVVAPFLGAVASRFTEMLIGNFFGRTSSGNTLELFLKTVSEDFLYRVESSVRAAFDQQNLLEIDKNVTAAATALRTYLHCREDTSSLDLAGTQILQASSRLFAMIRKLSSVVRPAHLGIQDPLEKGKAVLSDINVLKASMTALQAIAALDFTIMMYKVLRYPELSREIVARVGDYTELADSIELAISIAQSFRTMVKMSPVNSSLCHAGIHLVKGYLYVDGVLAATKEQQLFFHAGSREKQEASIWKFESEVMAPLAIQQNAELDKARKAEINAKGGIADARTIWADVAREYGGSRR